MASVFFQNSNDCSVSMILKGLRLEEYEHLLTKKGLSFDTFVNLTEEDMEILGITNNTHKLTILDGLRTFRNFYSEIDHMEALKVETVMSNTVHQLRTIYVSLCTLRQKLVIGRPRNTLIDSTTPATEALEVFIKHIKHQLKNIRSDLSLHLPIEASQKELKRRYLVRRVVVFGIATAILITGIRLFKR